MISRSQRFPSFNKGPGITCAIHLISYVGTVQKERRKAMSMETILIIVALILIFGGGGFYWRRGAVSDP
jgi:hypothetical protein